MLKEKPYEIAQAYINAEEKKQRLYERGLGFCFE
jgi:hypothetical protein